MNLEPPSRPETGRYWLTRLRRQLEDMNMTVAALEKDPTDGHVTAARCNICLTFWECAPDMDAEEGDAALQRFVQDHKDRHQAR